MKRKIGFLLMPGFRNADVVGTEAALRFHPNNKIYYIGEQEGLITGSSQYPLKSTTTFSKCPNLDVLIIPEIPTEALTNEQMIQFIQRQTENCSYVIGISSGVLALGKAGVLKGKHATADRNSLSLLKSYEVTPVDKKSFVKDGKFITAGPSTAAIESAFYLMSKLHGNTIAKMLELNLEYNPQASFKDIHQEYLPEVGKKPLKVAVITPPGLYLPDVAGAIDVFSSLPNVEIYFVWKDKGEKKAIVGPTLVSNMTFKECPQVDVLISGAILPKETVDPELIEFYQQQAPRAQAVIGVCAGVFVAGAAGLLEGRMSVTNFHMLGMLKGVGAVRHNTETASDGKYHTAGPAIGSFEVALQVVSQLYGRETAAYIENIKMEYNPQPIFNIGTPKKAGKLRYIISIIITSPIISLYKPKVRRTYKKLVSRRFNEKTV
ncbi:DJ-1/PfpI family protein [Wukongibacter baidiensis]|uniref:DJ-1/PfpI family protein n=1 Tax=Wukongibacter baidiensis TaxID=1723361 RepID=UPI003D7F74C7